MRHFEFSRNKSLSSPAYLMSACLVCFRIVSETKAVTFTRPRKYIVSSGLEPPELGYVDIRTLADSVCRYDLNEVDVAWLQLANEEFKEMGEQ